MYFTSRSERHSDSSKKDTWNEGYLVTRITFWNISMKKTVFSFVVQIQSAMQLLIYRVAANCLFYW